MALHQMLDMDFAMMLMKLAGEGFKKKKTENYKTIYQHLSRFWVQDWETQYRTKTEKDEVYKLIKNMEL